MYRACALLLGQNKLNEAKLYLEKSVATDPHAAPARVSYGHCLLEQNRVQEAIAQLRVAVKLDPEAASAWFQLARAYQKAGDAVAAQESLRMYENLRNRN